VKVSNAPPGKRLKQGKYTYEDRPYSFTEQLRVLNDLRDGRAMQRRNSEGFNPQILKTLLNLGDAEDLDRSTEEERETRAKAVNMLYYGLFVVSLFIPCMGLLFKLTIHPQLANYYETKLSTPKNAFELAMRSMSASHSSFFSDISDQIVCMRSPIGSRQRTLSQ
jgi:hypothetical protein